ncbi:MAG TPA: 2-hydroxychromene-2-carboxylate isomerase [Myxococcales bacterium]|jgi:2-hydroxychromene-2-carboxylate isomerase|nr:2-hydroxychromene-2-carboxylate isomerase [Myxococcales bacterium]
MLDFWFEFASCYSYVGAMRVEEECARAGVGSRWKAFLLGPLFTEQLGIRDSPFNVNPVRGRYMWRDLERLCEKYGLDWRKPSAFPRHSVLAGRVACALSGEPRERAAVREIFRANFALDEDISDRHVIESALGRAGVDAKLVLERADSPEVKQHLRRNTDQARALGMFGAPNFVVGEELFFGQDRLADAIDWAKR